MSGARLSLDTMSCNWRFRLDGDRGRLHAMCRHALVGGVEGSEALLLNLTARGPVAEGQTWESGFDLAHRAIVQSFAAMTSAEAHKEWKRRA